MEVTSHATSLFRNNNKLVDVFNTFGQEELPHTFLSGSKPIVVSGKKGPHSAKQRFILKEEVLVKLRGCLLSCFNLRTVRLLMLKHFIDYLRHLSGSGNFSSLSSFSFLDPMIISLKLSRQHGCSS